MKRPRNSKSLHVVPQSFYRRDARVVATELLNKILVAADGRSGRIVEVEAYLGAIDPAAHSYKGMTPRTVTMFGPPGHMYVYFTYGMHWCCNAVCGETRDGTAVLLRALHPLTGLEQMHAVRPHARRDIDLCNGPAKLTQAMGISGEHDGVPLFRKRGLFSIVDDGTAPPTDAAGFPRVGISRGTEHLWRWCVPDNRHVSKA
jgi:DNA-3-methyladenine glycosylase